MIYKVSMRKQMSIDQNGVVSDIDSTRIVIQVRQGKGARVGSYAVANLLTLLREYWKSYHPKTVAVLGTEPHLPHRQRHRLSHLSAGSSGGQAVEGTLGAYRNREQREYQESNKPIERWPLEVISVPGLRFCDSLLAVNGLQ